MNTPLMQEKAITAWLTVVVFACAFLSSLRPIHAAISPLARPSRSSEIERTKEALALPLLDRLSRIHAEGPAGYRNLVAIMFDENAEMELRWKAVTAAGRIGRAHARPEIERALRSPVWYMRSAGLLAIRSVGREPAVSWAVRLLSDRALAVRVAAVEALAELRDQKGTVALWDKLNARENFRNGHSLYIRRKIAEALVGLDGRVGRESRFIGMLNDADPTLHDPAVRALEIITRKTMGAVDAPISVRRAAWLSWWRSRAG